MGDLTVIQSAVLLIYLCVTITKVQAKNRTEDNSVGSDENMASIQGLPLIQPP